MPGGPELAALLSSQAPGELGAATLVETVPTGWTDDPEVENMTVDFDRAIAQITPVIYPELLYELENGVPKFPDPSPEGGIAIEGGPGLDPTSDEFKAAEKKCSQHLPDGGRGGSLDSKEEG